MDRSTNNKGFSILVSVVLIGVAGLSTVFLLSTISIGMLRSAQAGDLFHGVQTIADACAEVVLQRVQKNTSLRGTFTIQEGDSKCVYSIANAGPQGKTINITFTKGDYVRRVRISLDQRTPKLRVSSWREVAI